MVTTVARPAEWRGSDLRTRSEVVQYLADKGGELHDEQGMAGAIIREEMGKGRALTQLLADMEADGMIRREIRGRRTFSIKLVDDWGLRARAPLRAVPAGEDGPTGLVALSGADLDYDQLAQSLLAQVARTLTAPATSAGDTKANGVLANRLKRAESEIQKMTDQLRELRQDKRDAEERMVEAERRAADLQHNLERLQEELAKPRRSKESGGVSIKDRLSAGEQAMLASLMRELPATPESKPRRRQR